MLELETDKATIEVPSSVAGRVTGIKVKQGDKVKVGAVVLTVDEAAGSGAGAGAAAATAAPGVRRLAREVGVDIDEVQGIGPEGRISQEDVKEHARCILSSVGTSRGTAERTATPLPDFERWGHIERQPMSSIRRATAEDMKLTIHPHPTLSETLMESAEVFFGQSNPRLQTSQGLCPRALPLISRPSQW